MLLHENISTENYHRNYTNAVEEPDEYIEIYRKQRWS